MTLFSKDYCVLIHPNMHTLVLHNMPKPQIKKENCKILTCIKRSLTHLHMHKKYF